MGQQMSASHYYDRGLILKRLRMFSQAIDDFRKAVLNPQYAGKAHVQIALCLKETGRHEEAVMAFRQAVVSPTVSAEDQWYILYHMGQLLEALGQRAESLELYGWIRKDAPEFLDVTQRIQHLIADDQRRVPKSCPPWQGWMSQVERIWRHVMPHVRAWLGQVGQWLSRLAACLKEPRFIGNVSACSAVKAGQRAQPGHTVKRLSHPGGRPRAGEKRRHSRASVCLRSQFSAKDRVMTGEGVLRDLSPWGCRVTSFAAVPVGESVECCIFLQGAANPVIIEGAVVRWISSREFGLSFTSVRPVVQQQIAQLCRVQAA